jgi:ElaB/YqjD/DUF883 family membrane-anchored ribosome-binding protein
MANLLVGTTIVVLVGLVGLVIMMKTELDQLNASIGNTGEAAKAVVEKYYDEIENTLTKFRDEATSTDVSAVNSLLGKVSSLTDSVESAAKEASVNMKQHISTIGDKLDNVIKQTGEKSQEMADMIKLHSDALKSMSSPATDADAAPGVTEAAVAETPAEVIETPAELIETPVEVEPASEPVAPAEPIIDEPVAPLDGDIAPVMPEEPAPAEIEEPTPCPCEAAAVPEPVAVQEESAPEPTPTPLENILLTLESTSPVEPVPEEAISSFDGKPSNTQIVGIWSLALVTLYYLVRG